MKLTVKGKGEYEWYDSPQSNTPIATGNSFTTKITADKTFYVQDAGSTQFTAGPSTKSFTGTAVNWGEIGANFTAKKPFMIQGLTIYVQSVYNAGNQTVDLTLEKDGNKVGTFTSNPSAVNKAGYVTFTLSEPIKINEPGNYTLTPKGNFGLGFFDNGPAYSSYEGNTDVVEFTGCKHTQNDGKYPFPGLVDWQIQAGSGCARAVVNATYDPNGSAYSSIEKANSSICKIYPNPAADIIFADVTNANNAQVQIINALGKVVASCNTNPADGINVSNIADGIYTVKIITADNVYVGRFVKR